MTDLRATIIDALSPHFTGAASGPEIDALCQGIVDIITDDIVDRLRTWALEAAQVERAASAICIWRGKHPHALVRIGSVAKPRWQWEEAEARAALSALLTGG